MVKAITIPALTPDALRPEAENEESQETTQSRQHRLLKPILGRIDRMGEHLSTRKDYSIKPDAPEFYAKRAIRFGGMRAIMIFGIFGIWSSIAPIDSAAVATGKVVLDSNKKTIQHLEGGIVNTILVREGQHVEKDQPLIRLDETTAKARHELLRKQYVTASATEVRLIAERDGQAEITFPAELSEKSGEDEAIAEAIESQRRLFETRKKNVDGRISILKQKIGQFRDEIRGLQSQKVSAEQQINLLSQEIVAVRHLVEGGNAPKSRLLALERQQADLGGQRGEYQAMMSRAQQSIGEAELEMINTRNTFLNDVNKELKETQVTLSDLEERIRASDDMFKRINILTPLAGTISDLQVHTIGGVIKPGDKLMDIIPSDDKLIVEAAVQPQDIDVVREGLRASVRLTAYKTRYVHPISGVVVNVSPDRFDDPQRGISYYKARVEVDGKELAQFKNVELYPGMPADVLIITGSRSLLAYLFSPIRDSFGKSFRED